VRGKLGVAENDSQKSRGTLRCMLGKNIKKAFPSSGRRAQGILDLVHSDVCGPMSSPSSLGGCFYYVIFIDDYSRKCWIYFLKAKSDTFDKFKEYKAFIEKQIGKNIKTLRTDNGGEFETLEFEDLCKSAGIKRQLTVPYNLNKMELLRGKT
jgi:transposase InsO family protein